MKTAYPIQKELNFSIRNQEKTITFFKIKRLTNNYTAGTYKN